MRKHFANRGLQVLRPLDANALIPMAVAIAAKLGF